MWASLGIYGQEWAKFGGYVLVRLIKRGWVIYLVGGCGNLCRSRSGVGGCVQVWAYMTMSKEVQRWKSLHWSD